MTADGRQFEIIISLYLSHGNKTANVNIISSARGDTPASPPPWAPKRLARRRADQRSSTYTVLRIRSHDDRCSRLMR